MLSPELSTLPVTKVQELIEFLMNRTEPSHMAKLAAGVAAVRGDRAQALDRLATAVDALKGVDMHLYAASARLRLSQALGGNEGRAIVEQVEAWMRGQGVKQPARIAEIFVPAVR
jgi:hypothetical protein